jgi:hypothetical protein
MEMMHRERVSHNLIIKPTRTWWQDRLISEVVTMTTSSFIDVRKYALSNSTNNRASQGSLYVIVRRYKKWSPLVLPRLIDALHLRDTDAVKGALHMLRSDTVVHMLARNWEYLDKYVLGLIVAWRSWDRVCPLRCV